MTSHAMSHPIMWVSLRKPIAGGVIVFQLLMRSGRKHYPIVMKQMR